MHRLGRLAIGTAFVGVLLGAAPAWAQDGGAQGAYPLAYVDRPLTLSGLTLSPNVSADVTRFVQDPNNAQSSLDTGFGVSLGAAFGITNDLEVEANLATLRFLPEVTYGNPGLRVAFRFLTTDPFEMGIQAKATVFTQSGDEITPGVGVLVEPGVPFLLRLGSTARLDFAPAARFTVRDGQPSAIGLNVPVQLAINIVDVLHIGARSSVLIPNLEQVDTTFTVPLGIVAGISLGAERPIVEIDPYFEWPEFAKPMDPNGGGSVNADTFTAGVTVRGFLYF